MEKIALQVSNKFYETETKKCDMTVKSKDIHSFKS